MAWYDSGSRGCAATLSTFAGPIRFLKAISATAPLLDDTISKVSRSSIRPRDFLVRTGFAFAWPATIGLGLKVAAADDGRPYEPSAACAQ